MERYVEVEVRKSDDFAGELMRAAQRLGVQARAAVRLGMAQPARDWARRAATAADVALSMVGAAQ